MLIEDFILLVLLISLKWNCTSGFSPEKRPSFAADVRCAATPDSLDYSSSSQSAAYNDAPQRRTALQKAFRQNGGVLYRQSVLTPDEVETMSLELAILPLEKETTSSVARQRLGAVLPQGSDTVRILQEGGMAKLIHRLAGPEYSLSTEIPVEVRVYHAQGSGMDWHIDDVLYDPIPQLEVVLTIENTSDCITQWKTQPDKSHSTLQSVETCVNSAIILQAGRAPHCVTSLKRGRRVIVKCAYAHTDASFQLEAMVPQFSQKRIVRRRSGKGNKRK